MGDGPAGDQRKLKKLQDELQALRYERLTAEEGKKYGTAVLAIDRAPQRLRIMAVVLVSGWRIVA